MLEKTIRFKSSPITVEKIESFFPQSKYHNKLHRLLKQYAELKALKINLKDKLIENDFLEVCKNEINNMVVLRNCGLLNFPIRLGSNKSIETDFIDPYWDEYSKNSHPQYTITSKQYVLLNSTDSKNIKIIEKKRYDAFKKGKNVKIYTLKLQKNIQIIYEE